MKFLDKFTSIGENLERTMKRIIIIMMFMGQAFSSFSSFASTSDNHAIKKSNITHRNAKDYLEIWIASGEAYFDTSCKNYYSGVDSTFIKPLEDVYTEIDFDSMLSCGREVPEYELILYVANAEQLLQLNEYIDEYQGHKLMGHRFFFRKVDKIVYDLAIKSFFIDQHGTRTVLAYEIITKTFSSYNQYISFIGIVYPLMTEQPVFEIVNFIETHTGVEAAARFKHVLPEANYISGFATTHFIVDNNDALKLYFYTGGHRDCRQSSSGYCL